MLHAMRELLTKLASQRPRAFGADFDAKRHEKKLDATTLSSIVKNGAPQGGRCPPTPRHARCWPSPASGPPRLPGSPAHAATT